MQEIEGKIAHLSVERPEKLTQIARALSSPLRIEVLKAIYPDIISGIVPACYAGVYMDAGYLVSESSTNFVSIKGGFHGED